MPPELVPKGAENYRPRIVYRPAFAILQAIVFGGAFIIVGLSMVPAASEVGASGVVVGSLAALFGALLAAVLISTRLVVDSEKLVFWSRFRKKAIPWSDVQGFTIGVAKSFAAWSCLLVITGSGPVRIDGVVGSSNFVKKKIAELEDVRRRYVKT